MTIENVITAAGITESSKVNAHIIDTDDTNVSSEELDRLRSIKVEQLAHPEQIDTQDQVLIGKLDFFPEYNYGQLLRNWETAKTSTRLVSFLTSDPNIIANRENIIRKYGASFTQGGVFSILPAYATVDTDGVYQTTTEYRQIPDTQKVLKRFGSLYVVSCLMLVPSQYLLQEMSSEQAKQEWDGLLSKDATYNFLREILFAEACKNSPQFDQLLKCPTEFHVSVINSFFIDAHTRILIDKTNSISWMPNQAITVFNVSTNHEMEWEKLVSGCSATDGEEEVPCNLEGLTKVVCSDPEIAQHLLCTGINPLDPVDTSKLYPIVHSRYQIITPSDTPEVDKLLRFENTTKDMRQNVRSVLQSKGVALCYPIYIGEFLLNLTLYNNYRKYFWLTSGQKKALLNKFSKDYQLLDEELETEPFAGEDVTETQQKQLYDLSNIEDSTDVSQIDKIEVVYDVNAFCDDVLNQLRTSFNKKKQFMGANPLDDRKLNILMVAPHVNDILREDMVEVLQSDLYHGLRMVNNRLLMELGGNDGNNYLNSILDGVWNLIKSDGSAKPEDDSKEQTQIKKFCKDYILGNGVHIQNFINKCSELLNVDPVLFGSFWKDSACGVDDTKMFEWLINLGFFPLLLRAEDNGITNSNVILPAWYNPFIGSLILNPSFYKNFIHNIADLPVDAKSISSMNVFQSNTYGTSVCGEKFLSLTKPYDDLIQDGKAVDCLKAIILSDSARAESLLFSLIFQAIKATDKRVRDCLFNRQALIDMCCKQSPELKTSLKNANSKYILSKQESGAQAIRGQILEFDMNSTRRALSAYKKEHPEFCSTLVDTSEQTRVGTMLNTQEGKKTEVYKAENGIIIEDIDNDASFVGTPKACEDFAVERISGNISEKIKGAVMVNALNEVLGIRNMLLQDYIQLFRKDYALQLRAQKLRELQKLENDIALLQAAQDYSNTANELIEQKCSAAQAIMERQVKSIASKIASIESFPQVKNVIYIAEQKRLILELQDRTLIKDHRGNTLRNLGPVSFCFPFDISDEKVFSRSDTSDLRIWQTPEDKSRYTRYIRGDYRDDNNAFSTSCYGPRVVVHGNGAGGFCAGELQARLDRAASMGNLPMYVMLVIQYIESFNEKDYWGQRMGQWCMDTNREGLTNFFRDVVFGHGGHRAKNTLSTFASQNCEYYTNDVDPEVVSYASLFRYHGIVSASVLAYSLVQKYRIEKCGVYGSFEDTPSVKQQLVNDIKQVFEDLNNEVVSANPAEWVVNGDKSQEAIEYQKLPSAFSFINLELCEDINSPDCYGTTAFVRKNRDLPYNVYSIFQGSENDFRARKDDLIVIPTRSKVIIKDKETIQDIVSDDRQVFKYDMSTFGINRALINLINDTVDKEIVRDKYRFIVPYDIHEKLCDGWVVDDHSILPVVDFAYGLLGITQFLTGLKREYDVTIKSYDDCKLGAFGFTPCPGENSTRDVGTATLGWSTPVTIKQVIPGYNLVIQLGTPQQSRNVLDLDAKRTQHCCARIAFVEDKIYTSTQEKDNHTMSKFALAELLKNNKEEFVRNAPFINVDTLIQRLEY